MIVAPIQLAGPWQVETSLCVKQQEPQVVGFHLQLLTEMMDHREHLRNADALLTSGNRQGWFSSRHRGFEFDGRRLILQVHSKFWPWQDDLTLDVEFNEASRHWSGRLTCNGDVQSIALSRPHGEISASLSPLTGDWAGRSELYGFVGCLHGSQQKNGEVILCIDRESGGQMRYGQRISGGLYDNELRFSELNTSGNEQSFTGTLSADGSWIYGHWSAPLRIPLVFKRVEDGACTLANSR